MVTLTKNVENRFQEHLKKYQGVVKRAIDNDINERDTVKIVTSMLSYLMGYDKFEEITSELAIRKTFCDLAIRIDHKVKLIIEVKSVGTELKDNFVRQAVNYGANAGVDYVVLTNGHEFRLYKVVFSKPIDHRLIYEFNLLDLNGRKQADLEKLYYLTRESIIRKSLDNLAVQKTTLCKYFIAQTVQSNEIVNCIRRVMQRSAPGTRITNEEIAKILANDVLKREVVESDKAKDAKKRIVQLSEFSKN